jgi:hypothetical protein
MTATVGVSPPASGPGEPGSPAYVLDRPRPAPLRDIIRRLSERYGSDFEPGAVAATVDVAYRELASSATVQHYLPVLTERRARAELDTAMHQADGRAQLWRADPERAAVAPRVM